uniref:Uncharacterized protein n=1 Tax=Opuntia streptacantha TaxID=393608 RepID=A0A7C8ZZ52_OPUST
MKLVWSPETASKAYIDTVKSCELYQESGVAELISAMAAGWNAKLIVEAWAQGGGATTSVGLAIAGGHTSGRYVCIAPDEHSRSEYASAMATAGASPEILVGEPEEVMAELDGIDFLVVDGRRQDFARFLRAAKLSHRGAVLVCKNAAAEACRWRGVAEGGKYRVVRTAFLPVGQGLDIAHVAASGASGSSKPTKWKWVKHIDQRSGEEHVIRTC